MSHCNGKQPHPPLRQSTIDYMHMAGLSAHTQRSYLLELDRFTDHFGVSPAQLNAEQIQGYVLGRINAGLKSRSTNVTIAALRVLYRRVLKQPDRVESLVMRKATDRLPNAIEEAEIKCLIQATHNLRYRTAIELAYCTGLRISEVVALKVSDIDSVKELIHVGCGKGGHERVVFMPQALL